MEMSNEVMQYATLAGCVVVVGLLWYLLCPQDWEWLTAKPKRRGEMLRRERRRYVDVLVTDGFTSNVEDLVMNGTLTRSEATEIYRRMKQLFPIRDLFPSNDALKENIRRRIIALQTAPPIPFPDRKRKKHMFDKT